MKTLILSFTLFGTLNSYASFEDGVSYTLNNSKPTRSQEIVLNLDNCKRNTFITHLVSTDFEQLVQNLDAQEVYICTPQGNLRDAVDTLDIRSAEPEHYGITLTDLNYTVSDYHVEGKKNIVIYHKHSRPGIARLLANEEYSIKARKRGTPCHQELGIMCEEGKIDACFIPELRAEIHECVDINN